MRKKCGRSSIAQARVHAGDSGSVIEHWEGTGSGPVGGAGSDSCVTKLTVPACGGDSVGSSECGEARKEVMAAWPSGGRKERNRQTCCHLNLLPWALGCRSVRWGSQDSWGFSGSLSKPGQGAAPSCPRGQSRAAAGMPHLPSKDSRRPKQACSP